MTNLLFRDIMVRDTKDFTRELAHHILCSSSFSSQPPEVKTHDISSEQTDR